MKTTPTDLDREAAQLFVPAPGVRAWKDNGRVGRIVQYRDALMLATEDAALLQPFSTRPLVAFDTDDGATRGEMLAQVRDATPQIGRRLPTTDSDINGIGWRMWCVRNVDSDRLFWRETEGAALVAAMRVLKGKP